MYNKSKYNIINTLLNYIYYALKFLYKTKEGK